MRKTSLLLSPATCLNRPQTSSRLPRSAGLHSTTANSLARLPVIGALAASARSRQTKPRSRPTTTKWALLSASNSLFPASSLFPAGPSPVTCLHKILEKLDFSQWTQPATSDLVREQLRVHGLPEAEFEDVIVQMLGNVMTARLDDRVPGLTLGKLTTAQCLHELEFLFPLAESRAAYALEAAPGIPILRG